MHTAVHHLTLHCVTDGSNDYFCNSGKKCFRVEQDSLIVSTQVDLGNVGGQKEQ